MTEQLMRLPDVVAAWGIADGTHDHEVACRWLADQIRAGKIRARKIRRHWWMSLDDRLDALEVFGNRRCPSGDEVVVSVGLSALSSRRRAS